MTRRPNFSGPNLGSEESPNPDQLRLHKLYKDGMKEEAEVVGWIKAASILLGVNPAEKNLLESTMTALPQPRSIEAFVCHLGDHDWVVSVPAAQWMIPVLKTIAKEEYGMNDQDLLGNKFNAFRNYIFSQKTIMGLYQIYASKGKRAVAETVFSLVKST